MNILNDNNLCSCAYAMQNNCIQYYDEQVIFLLVLPFLVAVLHFCQLLFMLLKGNMHIIYTSQPVGVALILSSPFCSTGCQTDTTQLTTSVSWY